MTPVLHPGRLLKRELVARALSANKLSLDIGVPADRVTDILNGRRAITADTAVRLGRYFGNGGQFWLGLQGQYDIGIVERKSGAKIAKRIRPADVRSTTMLSSAYALFRKAILEERRVVCTYEGRHRELCPHIIGSNKAGEEVVLAWQFAGESSGTLPQWRCLKLANVRDFRTSDGPWHAGRSHRASQTCVSNIDLDINIHVRTRR
jgi:addiction module HigA family antidote